MMKKGYRIDIRTIPSAVCGDPEKRKGVILAKSIPAKKYDIHTGETIYSAIKKCPNLVLVKSNFEIYQKYSNDFLNILKKYFNTIEQASIDECYIDYTSYINLYKEPIDFAYKLKAEITSKLGFTVNIGISENKVLAKMASDLEKPDKVHTLFKNEIKSKIWNLPIQNLFMLGKKNYIKLSSRGFKTIGDIANSDPEMIKRLLGNNGYILWQYSNGIDNSSIETYHDLKSISFGETLPFDIISKKDIYKQILKLSEEVGRRLRNLNLKSSVISLDIKNSNFEKYSHQKKLTFPVCSTHDIYLNSIKLFDQMNKNEHIRSITLALSCLSNNEIKQMSLFDLNENVGYEKIDKAIDKINVKYKNSIVKRAGLL